MTITLNKQQLVVRNAKEMFEYIHDLQQLDRQAMSSTIECLIEMVNNQQSIENYILESEHCWELPFKRNGETVYVWCEDDIMQDIQRLNICDDEMITSMVSSVLHYKFLKRVDNKRDDLIFYRIAMATSEILANPKFVKQLNEIDFYNGCQESYNDYWDSVYAILDDEYLDEVDSNYEIDVSPLERDVKPHIETPREVASMFDELTDEQIRFIKSEILYNKNDSVIRNGGRVEDCYIFTSICADLVFFKDLDEYNRIMQTNHTYINDIDNGVTNEEIPYEIWVHNTKEGQELFGYKW